MREIREKKESKLLSSRRFFYEIKPSNIVSCCMLYPEQSRF